MVSPKNLPKIYLASQSPRRRLLLEGLGIAFETLNVQADEAPLSAIEVRQGVTANAHRKATAGLQTVDVADAIVVGADTVVSVGGKILGKPSDVEHAREMLQWQSGRTQTVYTGLALASRKFGEKTAVEESKVTFRKISSEEIEEYLKTKEPFDKAGAYAIQGVGAVFIDEIQGSYSNIMGFPLERFLRELGEYTGISIFQWFR